MLWRELVDLEPGLIAVEAWCCTLDPDAPKVIEQIKDGLRPLVGWHRPIPGYEEVPFDGVWPGIRDAQEHDRITGNTARKHRLFSKVPVYLRVLYTSEAWDAALHHLTIILRARRRELEKSSCTNEDEPNRSNLMDMFGNEPDDSSGYLTVSALRRALKGKPGNAFVYMSPDGKNRCPVVEVKYEASEAADEGGVGEVVLFGDGAEDE